eukprot:4901974-Prymnesium_polylepis.1
MPEQSILGDGAWLFGTPLPGEPCAAAARVVIELLRDTPQPSSEAHRRLAHDLAVATCVPALEGSRNGARTPTRLELRESH